MPNRIVTFVLLFVFTSSLSAQMMRQQARIIMQQPVKIDVIVVQPQNQAGQLAPVQVVLRDGQGRPINAREPVTADIQVQQPSGQVTTTKVVVPAGESSQQVNLLLPEAGVTKLSVNQVEKRLIGSTNYILVNPRSTPKAAHKTTKKSPVHKKTAIAPTKNTSWQRDRSWPGFPQARLVYAAYWQDVNEPTAADNSAPELMLKVSGENDADGVRADGTAFARVQVFYMGPELTRDVKIWLDWSNGDVIGNPIIIHRGENTGEAHWTSHAPIAAASIRIAATDPSKLHFVGDTKATVKFSQPILGVGFANAPDKVTIVDAFNLTGMFFDPSGNPIQTSGKRPVYFASSSPILRLSPGQTDVPEGSLEFSTMVVPTFVGKSYVEVWTPGYHSGPHLITVTYLGVLLICMLGATLGGVLSYINSKGKLWARIVTGIVVGIVASWAYVCIGLPNTPSAMLHSQLSVLIVSILAAFAGVKVLSVISKALNFGF